MAETYTDKLRSLTYAVIHNPNCPSPFQVRLVAEERQCSITSLVQGLATFVDTGSRWRRPHEMRGTRDLVSSKSCRSRKDLDANPLKHF